MADINLRNIQGEIGDIRLSRLQNPLVWLFKRNEIVDILMGALDFSRSSPATYINSYGIMKYAGTDVPRQEFNGWLFEGERTNLVLMSGQPSQTGWTLSNVGSTVPYNLGAPDKVSTAYGVIDATVDYVAEVNQAVILTPKTGDVYTLSAFVKKGTASSCRIKVIHTSNTSHGAFIDFEFSAESFTSGGLAVVGASVEKLANGWYRLQVSILTGEILGYTNSVVSLYPAVSVVGGIADTGETLFWGVQLELGNFASSYIPTNTSSVTRTSDNASIFFEDNSMASFGESSSMVTFDILGKQETNIYSGNEKGLVNFLYAKNTLGGSVLIGEGSDSNKVVIPTITPHIQYKLVSTRKDEITRVYTQGIGQGYDIQPQASVSPTTIVFGNNFFGHILDFRMYHHELNPTEVGILA